MVRAFRTTHQITAMERHKRGALASVQALIETKSVTQTRRPKQARVKSPKRQAWRRALARLDLPKISSAVVAIILTHRSIKAPF
mgnify:CR=1 FL=1